jgi:predicted GTPase
MPVTEKKVLLIGGTGAGKSYIGNIILGEIKFKSSASGQSVTDNIEVNRKLITLPQHAGELVLHVIDTPGIGDTQGKSVQYLDSIIQYIRNNTINMIIIVLAKGKFAVLRHHFK